MGVMMPACGWLLNGPSDWQLWKNLHGLNPARSVEMVHDGVPRNGERSDLTARFHIKRVGADQLTLEFLNIHVM
jgi:hypothetical protein